MNPDERTAWLERIKAAVLAVEPTATVMLYGSRARGDARPDSDWDFLILVDGPVDYKRRQRLWDNLFSVELESGEMISSVVHNRQEWTTKPIIWTPFFKNVEREGMPL